MNDASSGVRGEIVHVPRSDAGRLAFELLANVLRERCLPGTGGAGNQDVVTFDVLLDRPKTRREMIDLAVSMLEFLRHEFVAERTGVTDHRLGLQDSLTCVGAVRGESRAQKTKAKNN